MMISLVFDMDFENLVLANSHPARQNKRFSDTVKCTNPLRDQEIFITSKETISKDVCAVQVFFSSPKHVQAICDERIPESIGER